MIFIDNSVTNSSSLTDRKQQLSLSKYEIDERDINQNYRDEISAEDNRVLVLENNINFLKAQHDALLVGLYSEIENLRRKNKELQFRLVMCCCNPESSNGISPAITEQQDSKLQLEVTALKELLENEKRKNSELLQQIHSLQSLHEKNDNTLTSEIIPQKFRSLSRPEPCGANLYLDFQLRKPNYYDRSSHQFDQHNGSKSELLDSRNAFLSGVSDNLPQSISKGNQPISPLRRSVPQLPDGIYIKRPPTSSTHVRIETTDDEDINTDDYVHGTRIIPVKLPAIKGIKPLVQTGPEESYETNNCISPTNQLCKHESFDLDLHFKSLNLNSSRAREAHSARNVLGHNSIALFDPPMELLMNNTGALTTSQQMKLRKAQRAYSIGMNPSLPSLSAKSTGINQRKHKSQISASKRLNRTHDLYPS